MIKPPEWIWEYFCKGRHCLEHPIWIRECTPKVPKTCPKRSRRGAWLRQQILRLIQEHHVLNTAEVCRLLNGFGKDDYKKCYEPKWDFREPSGKNRERCRENKNDCFVHYWETYRELMVLVNKHYLYTRKMRFFEETKDALPTDVFRFWFINKEDFHKRVLSQTLIPYINQKQKS